MSHALDLYSVEEDQCYCENGDPCKYHEAEEAEFADRQMHAANPELGAYDCNRCGSDAHETSYCPIG